MSQGERNALALSVFLPRVSLPDSPFGFVVIDDPVQAMDPAKVDGLARVLDEVARARQVIVFTHDDRLAQSVRRLGIEARIVEVTREQGSKVSVTSVLDPAARHLDDARAVASDRNVPAEQKARVVAELCRFALEPAREIVVRQVGVHTLDLVRRSSSAPGSLATGPGRRMVSSRGDDSLDSSSTNG